MGGAAVETGAGARRTTVRLPYLPALDGLRGIALIAILLAHGGVERVRGGHLALTAFFTLSGFLITALLLVERHRTGTVDLKVFWARRARRLVPALLLTFPLVAGVVLLAESPPGSSLALDAVAAATWVANWRFISSEQSYADVFALPSPFQHFWSLAVEEQFYLVFPLLLLAVLGLRSARARTGRLAVLLGLLVVASTVQMARLEADGGILGRAYYGTDARLAEILVGSLLALAMVGPQGLRPMSRRVRGAVGAGGVAGLVGLGWLVLTLEKDDPAAYRGGFLLAAVCTAAVVASGVLPGSPVTRLLSWRPLVWLGLVSYGVYLFHWPLFLLLTERYTGLDTVPLLALRIGSVLLLAWLSLVLLERPVRSGGLPALPALGSWATGTTAGVVLVVAAAATITLAPAPVDELSAAGALPPVETLLPAQEPSREPVPPAPTGAAAAPVAPAPPSPSAASSATAAAAPVRTAAPSRSAAPRAGAPPQFTRPPEDVPVPTPPPPPPPGSTGPPPLKVAVVGDSISDNLATGLGLWAEREKRNVTVVGYPVGGCPIARGDRRITPERQFPDSKECSWWWDSASERQKSFTTFAPDVVLVSAGISEVFDRKVQGWSDYKSPGDPQYDQYVVSEYQQALDLFARNGAKVVVANAACADWGQWQVFDGFEDGPERVHRTNRTYLRVLQGQQVDLFSRLCPGGRYTSDVEGVPGGRYDGFHLTDAAAEALARNWLGQIVLAAGGRGGSSVPLG